MATDHPDGEGAALGPSLLDVLELVPEIVSEDPTVVALRLRERHGHLVRLPALHPALDGDVYLVAHPRDVQSILQTNPGSFGHFDVPGARDFGRVVKNSIVSLSPDGATDSWADRTRALAPEFTRRAAAADTRELAETTLATLAEFETGPDGDPSTVPAGARVWRVGDDGTVDAIRLLPAMRRLALRLLGVSLFGSDVRAHEVAVIDAIDTLRSQFASRQLKLLTSHVSRHLPDELHLPNWLQGHLGSDPYVSLGGRGERRTTAAIDRLVDAADAIVARRELAPRAFDDALATWLTRPDRVTGETIDPATLRQEVLGLLIAGQATTSAGLAWAVYLLASRPGVQARIAREARATDLLAPLATVLDDGDGGADGPGTGGDDPVVDGTAVLDALPYTRRVWREALRLYPPLPLFGRTATADVELGGVRLPAGTHVLVSPFVTHRDPAFWRDPERFDPDRFAPERAARRPEFAYFPFSGGRHACLGEQVATTGAVVALASTLSAYRVEFADGVDAGTGPHPDDSGYAPPVGVDSAINLQPDRGVHVRFVPRE
jgi:cytochrome P450